MNIQVIIVICSLTESKYNENDISLKEALNEKEKKISS